MTTNPNLFREALESAVEDALAKLPQEIVTAVYNACDDERGRLLEENGKLRAQLDQLNAAANRALDSLNMLISDSSDPGVEALGARYELRHTLVQRLPHTPDPEPTTAEQDRAAVQRMWDLAAYWTTVPGGEQVAEAITSVLEGTHRPLPDCTAWAWPTAEATS